MVLDLVLIALAITLDPLPLMAFVLVVASARGVWKGLAFILGWLACFVVVIAVVLSLTGGQPPPPRSPPSTLALVAKLVIGVSLVLYAAYRRRRPVPDRTPGAGTTATPGPGSSSSVDDRTNRGSLGAAAGLAVLLQPWGLVAAGAVTVMEADTSHFSTWVALFAFCVLATASLLAAELYMVFAPTAAKRRLLAMRTWMERHKEQAMVVGSLVIGLWLVAKSIYELTG